MEPEATPITGYDHLETRLNQGSQQAFIKGKKTRAIDVYLAWQRNEMSASELARSLDVTSDEIRESIRYCEWHRDQRDRELGLRTPGNANLLAVDKAYAAARFIVPAMLFVVGVLISIAFKGLFSLVAGILCFILFLRFANEIPVFGWVWVKVFGRQDLWEWLRMTVAPVAIGIVGTYVTTTINRYQNQVNLEKSRNDIVAQYLAAYQPGEKLHEQARRLIDRRVGEINSKQSAKTSILAPSYEEIRALCDAPAESKWLSLHARTLLAQISSLEPPSDGAKTIQKRPILELLHEGGLIGRGSNLVQLNLADISDAALTYADLSDSCLRDINFIDYPATQELATDLRHARLDGSDLSGSNLKRANLRYANLAGADLRRYTSLSWSDLRGADLSGALIDDTTRIKQAIINTRRIDVDAHRASWWYPVICSKSIQNALQWTFLCVDSVDYYGLRESRLPFYVDDRLGKRLIRCRGLSDNRSYCGYYDSIGKFIRLPFVVKNQVPTK
jgi:hypothetical protein